MHISIVVALPSFDKQEGSVNVTLLVMNAVLPQAKAQYVHRTDGLKT